MSWIRENGLNLIQKLALQIIKVGFVPQHVAFIMDGNRRFANKTNVGKLMGHSRGFDKLAEVLKWCLELGVKEVTVYAFSIENFKRPSDEVLGLMNLARQKFEKLLEEKDELNREGINIRVIGDLSRLPNDLYELVAKAVCITKQNNRARLTIAFSYTARNEITEAVKCIVKGIKDKNLDINDIDATLLGNCLYTEDSPCPDLIIRTSGEIRLSDFMLWQSSCSYVHFTPVLWPEFTFWDLVQAVFQYQRSVPVLDKIKKLENEKIIKSTRAQKFIDTLYKDRYNKLKLVAGN